MAKLCLCIEPDMCGPVSVGTVAVIRVLEHELGLALGEALGWVDRAVFEGETVSVPAPSPEAAARCARRLSDLRSGARVTASVAE